MKAACRQGAAAALMLAVILLSGCAFTTRKLPVPKAPTVVKTASGEDLVAGLNDRWSKLNSLNANVEIRLSVTKSQEGTARDYTTVPGIILLRKPEMLRVVGFVPVVRTRMFDMVSNGKDFTLYMPTKDLAYKGPNTLTHKSPNAIENLRPGFFLNALVVRGVQPGDEYMVTADSDVVEDVKKKHLLLIPEYILSIMWRKTGSPELQPIRVIQFHREDLLPYQQDLYDDQGNLETVVTYGNYVDFGDGKFPSTVTIKSKMPQQEFQVVLTVQRVKQNVALKDDQFQIQLAEGTEVKSLQ